MPDTLAILSHTWYTNTYGSPRIVGQVYNGTRANMHQIAIEATFYDQAGYFLIDDKAYAYIDILRPGEKAPFELIYRQGAVWMGGGLRVIHTYALRVSGEETSAQPFLGIQFLQHDATIRQEEGNGQKSTAGSSSFTLIGEVTNAGQAPASQVRIASALLDADGNVVDIGIGFAERAILAPGELSPFELFIGEARGMPERYDVIAYGETASARELDKQARVNVLGAGTRADEGESLAVIGEVRNDDTTHASYVAVYASFYDRDDRLVAVGRGHPWLDVLAPGGRSPFKIAVADTAQDADHWTIWAQGRKHDDLPPVDLAVQDVQTSIDFAGRVYIAGTVLNQGKKTAIDIQVISTIYDGEGKVIAIGRTRLDGDLAPRESVPFSFTVQATNAASSSQLYVQGQPDN